MTTPSPEELVERLEARAANCDHNARLCKMNDYEEEQTLLEAEASILRAAASLIRAKEAREKVLEEALRPFAKEAAEWSGNGMERPDDQAIEIGEPGFGTMPAMFNLGDLRRAARALGETGK